MIDFKSRYVITDEQWRDHCKSKLDQYLNDPGDGITDRNDYNAATLAYINFLKTGDVETYIESSNKHGHPVGWSEIFQSNPTRNYEDFIRNIQLFWNWVLELPSERIENKHRHKEPKLENYFWSVVSHLYGGGALEDGVITNKLFLETFGEEFQPEVSFPYELGKEKWIPHMVINPQDMFIDIMNCMSWHLFKETDGFYNGIVVGCTDYWLSIVPHLGDDFFSKSGFFSLTMDAEKLLADKMGEDEKFITFRQLSVRSFFGQLYGFNIGEENTDYIQNDPELANYIKARFAQFDLPAEYYEFIAFLHRHNENALYASEGGEQEELKTEPVEIEEFIEPDEDEYKETELTFALRDYCTKHSFEIDDDKILRVRPGADWEIEDELCYMFQGIGGTAATESGTEPVEFLPSYVAVGLAQVDCQQWEVKTCTSDDGWMNATLLLENGETSEIYEMFISRVNNSDWVPEGFDEGMQKFCEIHASKTLKFLYSDGEFRMLPVSRQQLIELDKIISSFPDV